METLASSPRTMFLPHAASGKTAIMRIAVPMEGGTVRRRLGVENMGCLGLALPVPANILSASGIQRS